MRILYLSPRRCWPVDSGGRLRDYQLARQLSRHAQVTYATVCYPDQETNQALVLDEGLPAPETLFERYLVIPEAKRYTPLNVLKGLLGPTPLTVLNWTSGAAERRLAELGRSMQFDSIQVEGVHLLNYLPTLRGFTGKPWVLCDWHDILSEQMARYAETDPGLGKKWYAKRTSTLLRESEREALLNFDAHAVVSDRDRDELRKRVQGQALKMSIVENGVDCDYFSDTALTASHTRWQESAGRMTSPVRRLLFVGAMDYHANIDAVERFAREIWPEIREQHRELVFTVVGRSPVPSILELDNRAARIEVTGTVPDVRPYYREAVAVVVPLRMGSGTRLKILEAMAAGVPVISTALGAEGLRPEILQYVTIADTDRQFAEVLDQIKAFPERFAAHAQEARRVVREFHDWSVIGDRLFAIHKEISSRSPSYV